jgi:hypothetical protein
MSRLKYGTAGSETDLFTSLAANTTLRFRHLRGTKQYQFDGAVFSDKAAAITALGSLTGLSAYAADKLAKGYTQASVDHHLENLADPMVLNFDGCSPKEVVFTRDQDTGSARSFNEGFDRNIAANGLELMFGKMAAVIKSYTDQVYYTDAGGAAIVPTQALNPFRCENGDSAALTAMLTKMQEFDEKMLVAAGFTPDDITYAIANRIYASNGTLLSGTSGGYLGDGLLYVEGVVGYTSTGVHHRHGYYLPTNDAGALALSFNLAGGSPYYGRATLPGVPAQTTSSQYMWIGVNFAKIWETTAIADAVGATWPSTTASVALSGIGAAITHADAGFDSLIPCQLSPDVSFVNSHTFGADTISTPRHQINLYKPDYSGLPGYIAALPAVSAAEFYWPAYSVQGPSYDSMHLPTKQCVAIIGPAQMTSIKMKMESLTGTVVSGVLNYNCDGAVYVYTKSNGLRMKAHLLNLAANNPGKATEIMAEAAKLDGYEDALFSGVLLPAVITMPAYAARDSILGLKMAAAGRDIYTTNFGDGVTFKTAQNRLDGLPDQDIFAAVVDDAVTYSSLLPTPMVQYSRPGVYGITQHSDNSWWVVSLSNTTEVASITEYDALALYFYGLSSVETTSSLTLAAVDAVRDGFLGAKDSVDDVSNFSNPAKLGGEWMDFTPSVFMSDGYLKIDELNADALKRACLVMKGNNMSGLEATIGDAYAVLELEVGGWE